MSNISVMKRGDVFDMISHIDRGGTVLEMEDAVKEVVQECMRQMKKGKVTVELIFDPDKKTDAMRVSAKVKKKLPDAPTKAALFFPTPEGMLMRHDARQQRMFPGEDE